MSTDSKNGNCTWADKPLGYITDVVDFDNTATAPLEFWHSRKATYNRLYEIAEDLITAPASQAYVEWIF